MNTTTGYGGAIWVGEQAHLTLTQGSLSANTAQTGGGLYVSAHGIAILAGDTEPISINNNSAQTDGGAIYNAGGQLSIRNANMISNKTPTNVVGSGYGGTIASLGDLTLVDSFISLSEGRFGGAVFVGGTLTNLQALISHTSFTNNTASMLGGGLYTNSEMTSITVSDSMFNGNTASTGGGVARFNSKMQINRSSLTQNTATSGGGLYVGAGPQNTVGGYVEVHDATLSTNTTTGNGGGLFNEGEVNLQNVTIKDNTNGIFNSGGIIRLTNSVLQNPNYLNCDNTGTPPSSAGYNFATDNSCNLNQTTDQYGLGLDPMLGPLTVDQWNLTFYHMPQASSPLIDTSGPGCSTYDQRLAVRSGNCDLGAVEYGGLSVHTYLPGMQH